MPAEGPWFITPTALRQFSRLTKASEKDALTGIIRLAKKIVDTRQPGRVSDGGYYQYRVYVPNNNRLRVTFSVSYQGNARKFPQLISVRGSVTRR